MALVSSGALIDVLRQKGLLSHKQLAEVLACANGRFSEVRTLARNLVKRGWFSVYQINQLLAGRGVNLVLGPYHILDRLGKGGQSEVYKARHTEYEWIVALKVIRAELLASAKAAAQFMLEMEAMAELTHPNIVQFWDADKAGDAYYCAMEFIDGTDLGKVVRLTGRLPAARACEYIRQTALGLQHAHEHNLVHRDIKPVNLFLTGPGAPAAPPNEISAQPARPAEAPLVKILDWGLASLRPPAGKKEAAEKSAASPRIIGTVDYLSPEQAINPHGVDIRGDIYSLGCTFYYLLTGQVPFNGKSLMEKIVQHQKTEAPAIGSLTPDVPQAVVAIVTRMMAKNPQDRFQTPAAVAMALAPFCRDDAAGLAAPLRDPPQRAHRTPDETPVSSGTLGVVNGR
jgi:serine/threonine-protein kinase